MAQPSGIGTLNWRDAGRGALLAAFTALLTGLYDLISSGSMGWDWTTFKPIVLSSIGAFVAYLLKNLITNNTGQLGKADKETVLVSKEQAAQIK